MSCPRCQQPLRERAVDGVPVAHCASCEGLLVKTKHTIRLVQALEKQLETAPTKDEVIEPVPHDGVTLCCPSGHTMVSSGYMGARIAIVDRCETCQVLFIDGPEVEPLVRQYARTRARGDDRREHLDKEHEAMSKRVDALLRARAATKSMGGGGLGF